MSVPAAAQTPTDGPPRPAAAVGSGRSLAPDIARGLLLLFIALANVSLFDRGPVGAGPDPGLLDEVVADFEAVFVIDRSRPVFAILFGFGMAMMASRMAARGVDERGIRRVLHRRALWLIVFGMVHAVLLFTGDILALYGVTALIALWLVDCSNRVLHCCFWVTLVYHTAAMATLMPFGDLDAVGFAPSQSDATTYPQAMLEGLRGTLGGQIMTVTLLDYLPLMIVGFWLFRSQWLTRPQDHVPRLRGVFVVAMTANAVLAVPYLLVEKGMWSPADAVGRVLQALDGLVAAGTGVGYVCGFALLAVRWSGRGRRGVPGVLAAAGQRSLTAYLLQSVVFFAVLTGWGLGLAAQLGTAGDAVVAVAVWGLITLAMAGLARRGIAGPLDALIRRLTYRAPA